MQNTAGPGGMCEEFSKQKRKSLLLAMSGNSSQAISTEPITAKKGEPLEVGERKSQEL